MGGLAKRLRIYLVGGATAVLLGWRETTIDIDLKLVPEVNEILKALPEIKEALEINVELASPDDFIPAVPGWEERSEQKLSQIEPLLKSPQPRLGRHLSGFSKVAGLLGRYLFDIQES
ncbi:MAG TPA: hypothetical protein VEV42_15755 [Pyrinomonadaceae bacterium]|nr:hypothetical protein [Pyrinomonadaceae bacterium]